MATEFETPPCVNNNDGESDNSDQQVSTPEEVENGDVSPSQPSTTMEASLNFPQPRPGLTLNTTVPAGKDAVLPTPLSPISPALPVATVLPSSKPFTVKAFKDWSLTTLKCTKQKMMERLGHGTKTVDSELELQIEVLRDTHSKYQVILRQMQALTAHFTNVVHSQKDLADTFSDLSQKMPELYQEFACNSETQKTMVKSGEMLVGALEFFTSSLGTLCDKTIEDTLMTVKQYETARVEYDAFRTDFETLQLMPRDAVKLEEAQQKFNLHREKFDRLRSDLNIKLKLLDENKIKVMRRQLRLMQDAFVVYLSGNHLLVEEAMTRFNVSLATLNSEKPSWLETNE